MGEKRDIKIVKEFKRKLSEYLPLKKLILFGSRASGKKHEFSDFDLIVVSPKFKRKKMFERGIVLYDYWNMNYPVDFLCYTPEEFDRLKKKVTIVREALKQGIEIK